MRLAQKISNTWRVAAAARVERPFVVVQRRVPPIGLGVTENQERLHEFLQISLIASVALFRVTNRNR
jgi:hypothetical protein